MATELHPNVSLMGTGELKQIGDVLQVSAEHLRQLAENIQEVFWLIDIATQKVIYVSPAYEKLWGRTCASLYASANPWPDAIHPDDLKRVRQVMTTSLSTGTYDQVFRILRPDHSICWIHERAFPVRDETGKIYRIAGIAEDITSEIQADEELRSSEEAQRRLTLQLETEKARLIEAQAVSKIGSWETQFPSLKTTWSEETHRIFETDPKTFQPTHPHFLDLVHSDDRAAVDQAFSESIKLHAAGSIEHRVLLPGGRIKVVEERWRPDFDQQGEAVRAIGTCQDISIRKEGEDALRHGRTLQRMAERVSHLGAWAIELPGRSLTWSEETHAIHDMPLSFAPTVDQAISFYAPEYRETITQLFEECMGDGTPFDVELQIITDKGRRVWVRTMGEAERDDAGVTQRIQGTIQDISLRKAEEERTRQAETAVRESEARYRTMLQSMQAGVIVHGADSRITAFNAKATTLLGVTKEQMAARDPFDAQWSRLRADGSIFPEADLPYQRAAASRLPVRDVILGVRHSGTGDLIWLLVNANPVLTAQGEVAEVIVTFMDVTAQVSAEQAVRDSAQFTDDVLNSLKDHVAVLDEQGVIIAVNEAWRRFARENGAGATVFVGNNYLATCGDSFRRDHTPSAEAAATGIRSVLEGKQTSFTLEYPCDSPTQARWFRMSVAPLSGAKLGVVVSHHDITESKRAEADMQWKTAFLEAQVNASPDGVLVVDKNGKKILQNQRMIDLLKIPADIAGDSDDEQQLRWVKEVTKYPEQFAKRVAYLTSHPDEIGRDEIELKDGTVFDRFSSPVVGTTGNIYGRIWTFRDITERKRAEETLRASEKRFKAVFEQAAVGVVQGDVTTGRLVQVNQRFCDIVGHSRQELKEMTYSTIIHPSDRNSSAKAAQQLKAGTIREYTSEKRYVRKDGSEAWADVTVSAMWAPRDPPDLFLAVVQDITERKHLEEHLRQTQKMEAVGTLAGGIAHDFNNILAAIGGYAELAHMLLTENPKVRGYLKGILKATSRATDLVGQILAFSRQQKLERRPINLESVVADGLKLLRSIIPSTIAFETSIEANTPTVLADTTQVHQVLMNLGTNAWHAMKDRPGRLLVKLEKCDVDEAQAAAHARLRPGLYVRLTVGDTGCGMDAATLRQMFDPFFTTKPPGEGTGLGLAVVHGIMESHYGVVTVSSHLGEGTVFQLYFPAHDAPEAAAVIDETLTPRGRGEKILVVDDEEVLAWLCQETLASLGYEVEVATQSEEALARVRADPLRFALVLTDQTMPSMTGLILAKRLHEIRPGLKIILMTGYSLGLTAARAKAEGVHQLLVKPVSVHALGTAVHAALSAKPTS